MTAATKKLLKIPSRKNDPWRISCIDRARGLAIALMLVDHVCLFVPGGEVYRATLGRAAMPLFFLLAGSVLGRLRSRHLRIGLLGAVLPLAVPWVDRPNVLLWWAVGCCVLVGFERRGWSLWLLVVYGLVMGANGYGMHGATFEPSALYGLMAAGRLLGVDRFRWADRLPRVFEPMGRHPVGWYVGHLVVLQLLSVALLGGSW